jgi:HJR/Mrr/RecB family endonuclease
MGEIDPGDFKQIFEGEAHDINFSWEDVDRLNPIQFERWVGSKFTRAGFSVKKTRATADYGVDLIVRDKSQDNVIALVQVKHKLRAGDSLKLGHEYYEKIRNQSAAYKAPDAKFALVSNASRVSASQRTAASKHQIEIFIREEIDNLVTSLL